MMFEWPEPRVRIDPDYAEDILFLDMSNRNDIWKPDLFIWDLVDFKELVILEPLGGISIKKANKTMRLYTTVNVKLNCKMNFDGFPFDRQECPLVATSANRPIDQVRVASLD